MNPDTLKIDLSYFYLITSGNKEFEQKLLTGTVADVDRLMANLKNCWEVKDPLAIRKNAHSLISLAAIVGIPDVEGWCRKIDHAFADNVFHPEYEEIVNDILSLWSVSVPQLNEMITAFNSYGSNDNSSLQ